MKHHDGFNRLPWKIKTFLCEDRHLDTQLKSIITACHIYLSFIGFFVCNTTERPHTLFPMVYVIRLNSSLKSVPLKLASYELQAERYAYDTHMLWMWPTSQQHLYNFAPALQLPELTYAYTSGQENASVSVTKRFAMGESKGVRRIIH